MFESDLPTEQELATEFSQEIRLLKDCQKIKLPVAFKEKLRQSITSVPEAVPSPYLWSIDSVINIWGGRLVPVALLLVVIGLGSGYYTYQTYNSVAPINPVSGLTTNDVGANELTTKPLTIEADSPVAPASQAMMVKTMAVPEAQSLAVDAAPNDFKAQEASIFDQALTDQPESEVAANDDDVDDQNDFSPIF